MDYCLAYITCTNKREAEKIGRSLVEEKLAACVNILADMTSIYMWEGSIQQDEECILIAKTKDLLFKSLTEKVCSLHSYSTPAILKIPMAVGSEGYKTFLDQNCI